jgi:hypothetical protein
VKTEYSQLVGKLCDINSYLFSVKGPQGVMYPGCILAVKEKWKQEKRQEGFEEVLHLLKIMFARRTSKKGELKTIHDRPYKMTNLVKNQ